MMRVQVATDPGSSERDNEDHPLVAGSTLVVIDGQTARTDTGCMHGVAWFTRRLGAALAWGLRDPDMSLPDVLAEAIEATAAQHPRCDLTHPGTPSAVLAVARPASSGWEYLVLGDVAVAARTPDGVRVARDDRVSEAARAERAAATALPISSPERAEALVAMKRAEHRARNTPDGYWCAAADPAAAAQALIGTIPDVAEVALLSDGAARLVDFGLCGWTSLLDLLASRGPAEVVRRVRNAEAADPDLVRWPRTKAADDATVVYATRHPCARAG